MHSSQRKLYSQNYLLNRELARSLVRASSIDKADTVLEIGPGKGILTQALLERAGKVIAVEIDPRLYRLLQTRFAHGPNLELHHSNFLSFPLPERPYKAFSNIPFRITSEIIRQLLHAPNPPVDSYLIVQKEAAAKWSGNTLASLLLQPWFRFTIEREFRRTDFAPAPHVDIALLRTEKRTPPLIPELQRKLFEDWLTYVFSRKKPHLFRLAANPTQLNVEQWAELFHRSLGDHNPFVLNCIRGSTDKSLSEQAKLEKIHRTRNDRTWRDYRPGL